ncbi:MAG: hypothetical protein HYV09_05755 [Deltaproteobacteria bacterium]|nr:hypothetical protein [Deltaproteobacteria bacterium]
MPKRASKPAVKPADLPVPVDVTLKRLWDKHAKIIAAAIDRDASAFDERWEAAAAIVDHEPPLYVVGGHKNAAEFFKSVLREPPRTAFRNMRVAKYFSPRDEAAHGVAKLDALLSFLEAKQKKPLGKSLPAALTKIRVPIAQYGRDDAVPLADATVAQLRAATKKLLKQSGRTRAVKKGKLQESLEAAFAGVELLAGIDVREDDGFVSLRRIPVGAFKAFTKALRGVG